MSETNTTPEYLPARMLNEFVYCPRLFYYESVEGVFADNRETVEGSLRHRKVDTGKGELPTADAISDEEKIHSRSVTLSSDQHGLIAKMDLIEGAQGKVTPVDYKRGSPRADDDGSSEIWDTDRVQLAVQAIVLRDNGFQCDEAIVYYVTTKQRVRIPIDDAVVSETLELLRKALATSESEQIPPPLIDSPKCPRCSLVGICLPDETSACAAVDQSTAHQRQLTLFDAGRPSQADAVIPQMQTEIRRLVPARALVAGKIRNQRTMLQRNHIEPPATAIAQMKCMYEDADRAESFDQLFGIEGNAARIYFQNFSDMIKVEESDNDKSGRNNKSPGFTFDFNGRNRRPPRDPVNALLSLAYSVLVKDLTVIAQIVGFDPYLGFYHQPRFGRPSLALDLMEPFRPLIADSAVLTVINTRMVTEKDFVRAGQSTALTPDGRKAFFRAYEQRMDSLVTHPLFGYRVNYRRMLEIQMRLLARVLTGELNSYPVFTTR